MTEPSTPPSTPPSARPSAPLPPDGDAPARTGEEPPAAAGPSAVPQEGADTRVPTPALRVTHVVVQRPDGTGAPRPAAAGSSPRAYVRAVPLPRGRRLDSEPGGTSGTEPPRPVRTVAVTPVRLPLPEPVAPHEPVALPGSEPQSEPESPNRRTEEPQP
ncbi:hypothetical protein [Streptomyces laurentii]|uniref:hypothetical protein n=1 Tax=Streptomyces laurentii TaxID=39478 RepID=UPI00368A5924